MKFVVDKVTSGAARAGRITKSDQVSLVTPGFLHFTKAAAVPFLSREVFNYLEHNPSAGSGFAYALSVDSTFHMLDAVRAQNAGSAGNVQRTGLAAFASLPNGVDTTLTCLTVKSAGEPCPSGHHEQDVLPVWTRYGKRTLTSEQYMRHVEAYRPDMFVTLCDGDTNAQCSRKRALKSAERSERFFDECLSVFRASDALRTGSMLLAPVEGGFIGRTRELSLQHLLEQPEVGGLVLDGFHNNGGSATLLSADGSFERVRQLVSADVARLPADKLRVMFGAYAPIELLQLCQAGVDLFDNSYAYLATKHACAVVFSVDGTEMNAFDLDMADENWKMEFVPLRAGCECLACTKHTRAYVHHLVRTNELLASILLMIHNIHHYALFFDRIRAHLADNTIDELIALVERQLGDSGGSRLEAKLREAARKAAEPEEKAGKRSRRASLDESLPSAKESATESNATSVATA